MMADDMSRDSKARAETWQAYILRKLPWAHIRVRQKNANRNLSTVLRLMEVFGNG
jgi:hypothetical protein